MENLNLLNIICGSYLSLGSQKKIVSGVGGYYSFLKKATDVLTHYDENGHITSQGSLNAAGNASYDAGVSLTFGYWIPVSGRAKCLIQVIDSFGLVYFTESFGYYIKSNTVSLVLSFNISNSE